MQITVDTQKDSKEVIRKAAAFLSTLSGAKQSSVVSEEGTNAFGAMFGSEPSSETSSEVSSDLPSTSALDLPVMGSDNPDEDPDQEEEAESNQMY